MTTPTDMWEAVWSGGHMLWVIIATTLVVAIGAIAATRRWIKERRFNARLRRIFDDNTDD